ncbi:MAG: FMN-binding protein [Muribaculaceae bacterium]|nr:FMN-binding protein [Muribaculaceae bacterium]
MIKIKSTLFALAIVAAGSFAPSAMAKGKTAVPQVIYTGEIAKKVIGYNGTTPVSISITNGRITSITALDNQETPAYFKKAKEKVINQFVGKTVDEALKLKADVATGATYSSEALIKNIKMGLEQAKSQSPKQPTKEKAKGKKGKKGKKRMTR